MTTKNTLLIDHSRSFLDGRPAYVARTGKTAIEYLIKNEGTINVIWMDYKLSNSNVEDVLKFLQLRAQTGNRYPVKMINVHSIDENGWQIIQARLEKHGYPLRRASVRDVLGF